MSRDLMDEAILEAKEASKADTKEGCAAAKRVKYLEQCRSRGAVLHDDGYIRFPDRPTLLGYD